MTMPEAPLTYRAPVPHDYVTHPIEADTGPSYSPENYEASNDDWRRFVREVQRGLLR